MGNLQIRRGEPIVFGEGPAVPVRDAGRKIARAFSAGMVGDHARLEAAGERLEEELAPDLHDRLAVFSGLGLGEIRPVFATRERFEFSGHGLAIAGGQDGHSPVCSLALGFLRSAISRATGETVLGAEVRCEARGGSDCRYVLMPRRRPAD